MEDTIVQCGYDVLARLEHANGGRHGPAARHLYQHIFHPVGEIIPGSCAVQQFHTVSSFNSWWGEVHPFIMDEDVVTS